MVDFDIQAIPDEFLELIGEIQHISYPIEQGGTSFVVFLHTDKGNFVSKCASSPKYRAWLSKEAKVMQVLNATTALSIPTYLYFMEDDNSSNLLMSLEDGVPLREALIAAKSIEEKKNLIHSFGAILKNLHETAPPSKWMQQENWLDTQLQKAAYNLQNFDVDGNLQLLESLIENKPEQITQTLIHGDCTIDNVLVKAGRVHMFIDLSETAYGDPRYDLALAIRSFIEDKELLDTFFEGYRLGRITKKEFDYFDGGLYEFF